MNVGEPSPLENPPGAGGENAVVLAVNDDRRLLVQAPLVDPVLQDPFVRKRVTPGFARRKPREGQLWRAELSVRNVFGHEPRIRGAASTGPVGAQDTSTIRFVDSFGQDIWRNVHGHGH